MSNPYLGEIRMFAGDFAPLEWHFCDGTILPISGFSALFALIGNAYGGDGVTTFALPDLRGRLPVHFGQGPGLSKYEVAEAGGVEQVTLTASQTAAHTHALRAASGGQTLAPGGALPAAATSTQTGVEVYAPGPANATFSPATILASGGSNQPHDNVQPYLCINFIMALSGMYPEG